MDKQDQKELKEVVEIDKKQIINFLLAYNLEVKNNLVKMMFSGDLENPQYKQLWELEVEPALAKVEFTI